MDIDDLTALNTHEAARILGVEPTTLNVWRSRGGGPPCRYSGAKPVYYLPDLRAWQELCRAKIRERASAAAAKRKPGRPRKVTSA